MAEYYFLASLLPQLEIGHVPQLNFTELKELLRVNVHGTDYGLTITFLRQIDIQNFRSLWAGEPIERRGNLNKEGLEQALLHMNWSETEEFPLFLIDFLEKYQTDEKRVAHYSELLVNYYRHEEEVREGFLKEYFMFQHEWQQIMVGFRSKKLERDLSYELQYEDVTEPLTAEILAQKDAKVYEPPFEYKELKPLFELYGDQPTELNKVLYEYQFNHIIELWGGEAFKIDRILNYMARLILVERWLELDASLGMRLVDTIERKIT